MAKSPRQLPADDAPVMGIGSCLAGNAVRYDGQTKRANQHILDLAESFQMRPFCPEMGIGLGVPRPPIHLVGSEDNVRVLDVSTHTEDFTERLAGYANTVLDLAPELCAYILVKGSPSCGYDRVKRFADNGHGIASDQQGIFAKALAVADPLLPLEDDGRLNDPDLRASFVTRAFTYHDWKRLLTDELTPHRLIEFYSRYKYLVMAHHLPSYKSIGQMLADAGNQPLPQLADEFISTLMSALTYKATRRSHTNSS